MMLGIFILFVVLTLVAPWFAADSRDGMDWRPYDEAWRHRAGPTPTIR
jgi:hypothetical protein